MTERRNATTVERTGGSTEPPGEGSAIDQLARARVAARAPSDVYSVIADPTRRRLLTALRGRERAVGDLVIELAVSQPTVSKHLRTLREGGLVRMRASGQHRLYSLRLEPLAEAARWLGGFGLDGSEGADDAARADPDDGAQAEVAVVRSVDVSADDGVASPIQRTVRGAAGRAAEMIANIPRLRRRGDRH